MSRPPVVPDTLTRRPRSQVPKEEAVPVVERVSAYGGEAVMVPPPPLVLALDLASRRTGWCLFRSERLWQAGSETHGGAALADRLRSLARWLGRLLDTEHPQQVWVEVPDLEARAIRTRPATLKALYMAHGIVIGQAMQRLASPDVHERDARVVREAIVGDPAANKFDVQITLRRRGLRLPERDGKPDHDACDALALALSVYDEWCLMQRAREGA